MKLFNHTIFDHVKNGFTKRKKLIIGSSITLLIIAGLIIGTVFGYAKMYENKIYPGVSVGGISLSGLTEEEAINVIDGNFQSMLNKGLSTTFDNEERIIDLRASGATDPDLIHDLIFLNVNKITETAILLGRQQDWYQNIWTVVNLTISGYEINPDFILDEKQFSESLHETFKDKETPETNTQFAITKKKNTYDITIEEGERGKVIDVKLALQAIKDDVTNFSLTTIPLTTTSSNKMVTFNEAEQLKPVLLSIINNAPYKLSYTSKYNQNFSWTIKDTDLMKWLTPKRLEGGSVDIRFDTEKMSEFFQKIHDESDIKPRNARFKMTGNRVTEFAGSIDGEIFNEKATMEKLLNELGKKDVDIKIVTETVEADITTGSVNDLGITDLLGTGVSSFAGSPSNRVKNILNGANKLNGLLIAPGDTLSLIEQLRPFTAANGYLPELVIKGDEIIPEMGGGLCQIGTTTFRAVMNSGLKIEERRNHSLVVSYYNDMANGNPGTDATLYEPAPDFKFTNDTENYILFNAEVDLERGLLNFSFWGTDDGRKGSYTPPVVLKWKGIGSTQYKKTDSLAPGVTRCQPAHRGAKTTFDYTVKYADGTDFLKTFTSDYRSLPKICLVGTDPDAPKEKINTDPNSNAPELKVNDVKN